MIALLQGEATSQLDGGDFPRKAWAPAATARAEKAVAALSLRASDELSHLGHRAASKDLVEVGPQSALHKVSEDTNPVARVREPWKPFREDVEVREVQWLAMTNSCGESPAPLNHGRTETQNTILIILNRPRAYRPSAPVSFHCRAGPTTAPGGSRPVSGQRCGGDPAFDTARWAYRAWHRQSRQCSLSSTS